MLTKQIDHAGRERREPKNVVELLIVAAAGQMLARTRGGWSPQKIHAAAVRVVSGHS